MKDQINILILISTLILAGIFFLIVKSLVTKPISFPSQRTIAKEWLMLMAAILLGLLLNLTINWWLYEKQVSASLAWEQKLDASYNKASTNGWTAPRDEVIALPTDNGLLPKPPKPEFHSLEIRFILSVMLFFYFARSILWAVRILKVRKE